MKREIWFVTFYVFTYACAFIHVPVICKYAAKNSKVVKEGCAELQLAYLIIVGMLSIRII